jgi:hypothetical protein
VEKRVCNQSLSNSDRHLFWQIFVRFFGLFFGIYFVSILSSCSNPLGSNSSAQSNFLSSIGSTLNLTDKDDTSLGFGGGSFTGTAWDGTNSYVRLTQTGTPTNNSELDSSWAPAWSNLVGYWKFNEGSGTTVGDSVGTYTGTWQGMLGAQWTTGKLNSAGNFDGSTNYVSTVSVPTVNNPLTVSAWVYPKSISQNGFGGGAGGTIVEGNESGNSSGWIFGIKSNGLIWFWPSGGNDKFSTNTVALNVWSYIVATYDGTSLRFYINGVLDSTQTMAAPQALTFFKIGNRSWITGYWEGVLDDVSAWNTALTAAQIQAIYSRQSATYAGTFQSRVMDGLASGATWTTLGWKPTFPFGKELPDANASNVVQNETSANYSSLEGDTPAIGDNNLMTGIVGLWHLDEAAGTTGTGSILDRSGQGNNGTPNGTTTFGATGKLGTAATFDGSTGYINVPTSPSLSGVSALSISVWFNPSQTLSGLDEGLVSKCIGGDGQGYWIELGYSGTLARMGLNINGTDVKWTANLPTFTAGNWYHFVFTYDGTTQKVYINAGTPVTYTSPGTIYYSGSDPFKIGLSQGTGGLNHYFGGSIDEVAVWNKALNSTEVLELYRRGANRIKYQIRSCFDSACATGGPSWLGPDGTNQTYFSELNSNSVQNDAADLTTSNSVQTTLPTMTFSAFGALTIIPNRYFQYRAIMESDDPSTACNYGSGPTWCSPELQNVSATIH